MSGLVTVFGGSGFVGTQVVRALAKRGWRVRVASRRPKRAWEVMPFGDPGQLQLVRADITDRASVERALEGATACVNLVGVLYAKPGHGFRGVHVDGARNVAETCAAFGVKRLVHFSANGADVDSPSKYAATKGEGERVVREAFPAATIVRPSIIFGQGDGFFDRFAQLSTFTPVLPLFGWGRTRFQPVYVGDVARAVAGCLQTAACAGQTYVLAGPRAYSFAELMKLLLKETGRSRILLPLPHLAASVVGLAGDVQSLVMTPILTSDQALLLRKDNVAPEGVPGLEALGITPTAVEAIAPSYLWRYRKGGQFAELPAPSA